MSAKRSGNPACWIAGIGLLTAGLAVAAVPGAWEKFPNRKNADAWMVYDYGDGRYYYPNWDSTSGQEHIWFYHDRDKVLEFSVDAVAGGGALVGDFAAANVDSVTVDLFIERLSHFQKLDCAIFTKGPDGVERWYYSIPYTRADFSADGWQRYVRFGMDEPWSYYNGTTNVTVYPDETFLKSVKQVAITFFTVANSNLDMRVGVDNFVLEPKQTPPKLTTAVGNGQFQITFTPAPGLTADLQKMMVIEPFTWSDVPGQTFIEGPSQHVFSTPLDEPKKIYRVKVFPEYTDVVTP